MIEIWQTPKYVESRLKYYEVKTAENYNILTGIVMDLNT